MPGPVDYVSVGWALCPIPRGQKGPQGRGYRGWNLRENAVTTPDRAMRMHESVGLCHAYSGTCAIDVDDLDGAAVWLKAHGIDLAALAAAPDVVRISSGRPGRAKLLYRLTPPLPSKKITAPDDPTHTLLEFRCGTHRGTTVQDALPPSMHPNTGLPYIWVTGIAGHWSEPPQLPPALRALWEKLVARPERELTLTREHDGVDLKKVRALLEDHDPDVAYDEWVKVGMALHHELGDDGLTLWDEWSAKGSKYVGIDDLETHWRSFGRHPNPVTLASLRVERTASAADFDVVTEQRTATPVTLANAKSPAALQPEPPRDELVPWFEFKRGRPLEWLVDKMLPRGELVVVYGESGCGKTFWTLDLLGAITRGIPWNGRAVAQGGGIYITAEGAGGFRSRVAAYAQQNAVPESLDAWPLMVLPDAPNMFDRDAALTLAQKIAPYRPSIIVIDTLAATTYGANENSGEDMNVVLAHCRGLNRATGATVVIVHHSGKDASRGARGWSGIRAALDAEIEITRVGDARRATVSKLRDGDDGQAFGFRLQQVSLDMDGNTSCVIEHMDAPPIAMRGKFKKKVATGLPALALETFFNVRPVTGGPVAQETLFAALVAQLPVLEGAKDRRPENARRAVQSLVEMKLLVLEGDNLNAL